MNGFIDDSLKGLWNEFALLGHESRACPSFVPPPSNLCEHKKKDSAGSGKITVLQRTQVQSSTRMEIYSHL